MIQAKIIDLKRTEPSAGALSQEQLDEIREKFYSPNKTDSDEDTTDKTDDKRPGSQ